MRVLVIDFFPNKFFLSFCEFNFHLPFVAKKQRTYNPYEICMADAETHYLESWLQVPSNPVI